MPCSWRLCKEVKPFQDNLDKNSHRGYLRQIEFENRKGMIEFLTFEMKKNKSLSTDPSLLRVFKNECAKFIDQ